MSLLKRIEKFQKPQNEGSVDSVPAKTGTDGAAGETARPQIGGGGTPSRFQEMLISKQSVAPSQGDPYHELKRQIQDKLLDALDPRMDTTQTEAVRNKIREEFELILNQDNIILSRAEKQRLFEQIAADILGFGPIQPLLEDDTVSEVMVNGAKHVYVERNGKLLKTNVTFDSNEHVLHVIDRIVSPLGRRIDESSPYVDARLPDGSRVNAIIPPLAISGPTLTIRKFAKKALTVDDLIKYGSITDEVAEFLKACVVSRLNIVVSGGTGSGKTTLLNILSGHIPTDERIVTVENAAELQLKQEHVVTLESRPPNIEGRGEVTIRDLVINCLRMRPDRIVVGECRGGEALDMLQAMNTGHDGSLTTAHSNTPRDTLSRLETMCLMAGMDLPVRAIREQIASAVDLIVHQSRMRDGSRKIVNVTEVQGMEGDVIVMSDIFEFVQSGFESGKVIGRLRPTGIRPKFMHKIEESGIHLSADIFGVDVRRLQEAGRLRAMPPLLVAAGAGIIIFLMFVIIGVVMGRGEQQIADRLEKYAGPSAVSTSGAAGDATAGAGSAKKTSFLVDQVDRAVAKKPFASGMALSLAQADLHLTVGEFLIMNFMSCLLFSLIAFIIGGTFFLLPVGAAVGFFVPRVYLKMRKGGRLKAFNDQLGDTITLMANALRAGYSLIQAMETVSREMPSPISDEFARVVKEVGLGLSHEEAMNHLLERVRSDDLDLLVTAINVQHEVGGNLSEILDSIGFTIRERVRIQGEVRVLTAQGMMSGYVISFLPIALMAILFLINREYIGAMFQEPCGWAMLALMAIMITVGFISIQKIVRIDV